MFGIILVLELAFLLKTLYPRNYMLAKVAIKETSRGCNYATLRLEIKRTTNLSFINIKPVLRI
jgi:hypothetical protein